MWKTQHQWKGLSNMQKLDPNCTGIIKSLSKDSTNLRLDPQ